MKVLEPFNKYAHLIPLPKRKTVYAGKGASNFGVNLIVKTAKDNYKEAQKLSAFLKGANLSNTLANIHHFVYQNFQYQGEGLEHNLQTLSRAYYDFRNEGINCEDASIIIVQLLSNLGIRSYVRRIHQAQNPEAATHVYVIVPKDQTTAEINGRNSYFVVDGTLPTFDLEAPFVKSIDTMAEPQVKYSVMNGANCTQAAKPQIEVLGRDPKNKDVIIILIKPEGKRLKIEGTDKNISMLKSMNCPGIATAGLNEGDVDWAALGQAAADIAKNINWASLGSGEEKRTQELLEKIKKDNNLHLYPRPEHGGPWRANLGAGRMASMTPDELRYFIEWRIPVWKKGLEGKNWGDTKPRVIQRYKNVADLLKANAIGEFKAKVGCYTHSGVYDDLVAKFPLGSENIALSASNTIRPFKENCGSDNGSLFTPGKNNGDTGNSNTQTASFNGKTMFGALAILGLLGGAFKMYKDSKKTA